MKKLLLLSAMVAASAAANVITYNTSATLGCGGVGNCTVAGNSIIIAAGGVTTTVTYTAASATNLTTPSNISLGLINVSSNAPSALSLSGLTLLLSVTQTAPAAGSAAFGTGTFTGTISATSSGTSVTFAGPTQLNLGNEQYTVFNPTVVPAPNSNNGQVTIQGAVADRVTATPEPVTFALAGAGIGLLGLVRRVRNHRS